MRADALDKVESPRCMRSSRDDSDSERDIPYTNVKEPSLPKLCMNDEKPINVRPGMGNRKPR